jgi:hypothetical protein
MQRYVEEARISATPERTNRIAPDPQRVLMRALELAFGDESSGRVLVHAALRSARRTSLPDDAEALMDFVRAHMMGALMAELGPRVVSALLEQLDEDLQRDATPPSTRRPIDDDRPMVTSELPKSSGVRLRSSVLLIDHDRFSRANLARALITSACDVSAAETPLDVRGQEGRLDVAIVNHSVPDVAAVLGALLAKAPDVRVIMQTTDIAGAEALLRAAGVRIFRVAPRNLKAPELTELIKRVSLE